MLNSIKKLIFGIGLGEAIAETKKIRVNGVNFVIKKLDTIDYMAGHSVVMKSYDTADNKRLDEKKRGEAVDFKRMRDHYIDVFMSGVVKPILTRKESEGTKISVDEIFREGDLAESLYLEIIKYTYGKKKIKLRTS